MGCTQASLNGQQIIDPSSDYYVDAPKTGVEEIKSGTVTKKGQKLDNEKVLKSILDRKVFQLQKKGSGFGTVFENSYEYIEQLYEICEGNLDVFFFELQQRMSDIYMTISKQTLNEMNTDNLIHNQSKVLISEEILWFNLNIFKVVGRKQKHKYNANIFKQVNKLQKNLVGYLKMKYPRGGQNFVASDLLAVFRQFDISEQIEFDILKNSNTYFVNQDQENLTKDIKIFFNKIIDQIDSRYSAFQKLMQQKVFVVKEDGDKKLLNCKIGRKIPETVSKFTDLESATLEISSPQIFRVIIKWLSHLEEIITNPNENINKKKNFKTIISETVNGQFLVDEINENEYYDLINFDLIEKIEKEKAQYQQSNRVLISDMDRFNGSLLRLLDTSVRKQKFVPVRQMEIIKYSNLNAKFISWVLVQKLTLALKKLIQIGQSFYQTKSMLKLDLISFKLSDLMRSMVSGSKQQILAVYQNLKQLEKNGQIKIIKIKNRLTTSLNDVMIIFSIKDSFLICQVQLILSEKGTERANKKYKNMEVLNHFFYQLERSPYGILSEIAVLLAYKDSKVSYEDSITFEKGSFQIKGCSSSHPQQVHSIKFQKKPFICSQCANFYFQLENLFLMKHCCICNIFICGKCIFQQNPGLKQQVVNSKISETINNKIEQTMSKLRDLSESASSSTILKLFETPTLSLREIFGAKNVQISKLIEFLNARYKKREKSIYFVIISFRKSIAQFKCLKYNPEWKQISNPFNPKQNLQPNCYIHYSSYDLMLFFWSYKESKASESAFVKPTQVRDNILYLFVSQKKLSELRKANPNKKLYSITAGDFDLLVDFDNVKKDNEQDNFYFNNRKKVSKKSFKYNSLHQVASMLPDLDGAKSYLKFHELGLEDRHLQFFKEIEWIKNIRQLKLSKNNLENVFVVLNTCTNLQRLYINQNYIKELIFSKKMDKLEILNCSENKIASIDNIQNVKNLHKLLLSSNEINNFPKCDFPYIKILNLQENKLQNYQNIFESSMPQLQQLLIESSSYHCTQYCLQENYVVNFPKLRILMSHNECSTLQISSFSLQRLHSTKSMLKVLQIKNLQCLRYLNLAQNKITNFDFVFPIKSNSQNHNIIEINLSFNQIEVLPLMKSNSLNTLLLSDNKVKDINSLSSSSLSMLEKFQISNNQIKTLCKLVMPKLTHLDISWNDIDDADSLENSDLGSLKNLKLGNFDHMANFPLLRLPELEELEFEAIVLKNMDNLSKSQLPKLRKLSFINSQLSILPKLYFSSLKQLNFQGSKFQNLDQLQNCSFDSLQYLNLQSISIEKQISLDLLQNQDVTNQLVKDKKIFCLNLAFPRLKKLHLNNSAFQTCLGLSFSHFPQLEQLELGYCNMSSPPTLNFKNLKLLNASFCSIKILDSILTSNLQNLQTLKLNGNQLQTASIKLSTLTTLQLSSNKLTKIQLPLQMPDLIYLNISYNEFSSFPVIKAKQLKKLQTEGNFFTNISSLSNCQLPSVEDLRIQGYDLSADSSFPKIFMASVKSLYFKNNKITDISNLSGSILPALEDINFSGNQIKLIPCLKFPLLKFLRVNKNKISDISALKDSQLPSLSIIQMQNNEVKKLPYMKFPKLKKIFMHENQCQSISQWKKSPIQEFQILNIVGSQSLDEFPNLQCSVSQLYLNRTSIRQISVLNEIKNLVKIQLNGNGIVSVPTINQVHLKMLQLESNSIQQIRQVAKSKLPQLEQFSIKQNRIKQMPKLEHMPSLLQGFFNQNQIENVDQFCQSQLPLVKMISFQKNCISKINKLPFPKLFQIFLSQNPLQSLEFFNLQEYPHLEWIVCVTTSIKKVQILPKMESLQKIWLNDSMIQSFQWFADSLPNLSKIVLMSIINNRIQTLPNLSNLQKLVLPNLKILMKNNPIKQFSQFTKTKPQALKNLSSFTLQLKQENDEAFHKKSADLTSLCASVFVTKYTGKY